MRTVIFFCVLGASLGLLAYAGEVSVYFTNYPKFLLIFAAASVFITAGAVFTDNVPELPTADVDQKDKGKVCV